MMMEEYLGESETITTKKADGDDKSEASGRVAGSFSEGDSEKNKNVEEASGGDPIMEGSYHHQLISLPKWETPCSSFFQQRGAIDFKSYLRLKKEEKDAVIQYRAATKIQALWRGFLTRCNMQILNAAAIKIQAFIRGMLARKVYAAKLKELAEMRRLKIMNQAAVKIQAAWRGYISRKKKLNFKEYKKIQEKNAALKRSIDQINDLENALLTPSDETTSAKKSSSSSTDRVSSSGGSNFSVKLGNEESVENLIRESFHELASNMSASRIAELYSYASAAGDGEKWDGVEIKKPQKKIEKKSKLRAADSIDDLFPEFPHIEGLIRPDDAKVTALKAAIRLLRQQTKLRELKKLEKLHYLLRTSVVPGVYSDIYCNELTEIEKQLKALKFWSPPPDPRKKERLSVKEVNFEYDSDEEAQKTYLRKHPSSPMNTALEDEEDEEETFEELEEEEAINTSDPLFPMDNNEVNNN